jgi:hypothetical protein
MGFPRLQARGAFHGRWTIPAAVPISPPGDIGVSMNFHRALGSGPLVSRLQPALIAAAALVVAAALATRLSSDQIYMQSERYVADLWMVMDAMWRTSLDQRANVDFVSPIGPLFYAMLAVPLEFQAPSPAVLLQANVLAGLLALLLTLGITWRSLGPGLSALSAALVFLIAVSGRDFGTSVAESSIGYLAPYNRWSWALAFPAALGIFLPHRARAYLPHILIGVATALLFYLKLTFAAVLLGCVAANFLIEVVAGQDRPEALRKAFIAVAAFAAALAAGALFFSLGGYLADVALAAKAGPPQARLGKAVMSAFEAALFLAAALLLYHLSGGLRRKADWPDVLRLALLAASGAALLVQNHDLTEAPLYFALPLLAFALGRRASPASPEDRPDAGGNSLPNHAFILMLIILAVPIANDLGGMLFGRLHESRSPGAMIQAFQGTPLQQVRLSAVQDSDGVFSDSDVPASRCGHSNCVAAFRTAEGLRLLQRLNLADRRVLPLAFSNPFSALTRTPSPRGALLWWHEGRSFSAGHAPPGDSVFREVDVVLVPKNDGTAETLTLLYGDVLRRDYVQAGESLNWIALARRQAGGRAEPSRKGPELEAAEQA